ncbi:MAG: NAD(P)/FAD-dependent oxidoreductase [Clostridiales bacterium]|nr:NAD(P)/FAD-dependent oxidoreductase [Clostridiales bacterium]
MKKYDIVIVGAGIVGTSIAYNLVPYDVSVVLLDKNNDIAMGATRANSAIIHAGYDPKPGTLMAKLNVEGNRLCERLCNRLDVPFRRCGSLVLAFSEEEEALLSELLDRGIKNGVPDIRILNQDELRAMEPGVSEEAVAALYAPSAGIVNPWELALAQAEVFVRDGGDLFLNTEVTAIRENEDPTRSGRYTIETTIETFETNVIILACGIHADTVHELIATPDFRIVPTRGEYYLLDKCEGNKVSHVIFQCPSEKGKGVLVSPTVHGNLICGPTSEVLNDDIEDTSTTSGKLSEIKEKAARSVGNISWRDNVRNFSGIRANSDADDFIIRQIPRKKWIFEAAGIKSPGLASSPAIGPYVVKLMKQRGVCLFEKKDVIEPNGEHYQSYCLSRSKVHFRDLDNSQREDLVKRDPAYGRIVCRCEEVTEGEIRDALRSPIPPYTLDGVKRRVGTGMGRCQGGFCGPRIVEMLLSYQKEELSMLASMKFPDEDAKMFSGALSEKDFPLDPGEIHLLLRQDGNGSNLFFRREAEADPSVIVSPEEKTSSEADVSKACASADKEVDV